MENNAQNSRESQAHTHIKGPFIYTKTKVVQHQPHHLQHNRIIAGFKPGPWLESYKMLRTRCLQLMDANKWNTLAITSPSSGSGNSLTAANLAISIAMEFNRSVLLVDANFQNPGISQLFNIDNNVGLDRYLLNDIALPDLLINPGINGLVVLPAGQAILNSAEMLRSPKMVELVQELKQRYPSRIIIFDLPPLLSHDDTLGFIPAVDCTLLVSVEGYTKTEELKKSATLLKDLNVLGTVFNKASDLKIKYSVN